MNTYETDSKRIVLAEDFKSAVAIYHQTVGEYPERMELMKAGLAGMIEQAMPEWAHIVPNHACQLYNILDNHSGELMRDYIDCLETCLAEAKAAMAKFPTAAGVYEKADGQWRLWQKPAPTALPPADNGWIAWSGGEKSPIADGLRVEVKFRTGETIADEWSEGWTWEHEGSGGDIIAYRVVGE